MTTTGVSLGLGPRALALACVVAIAVLAGASCSKSERAREVAEETAARAAANGPATAGQCAEHGVLEALCTKCNPSLVPVFQAKGDWCAEHGFPESICPACHPERGGRPAADVAIDEAPAHGLKVRLEGKETARLAGIDTAEAMEGPSDSSVVGVARIVYDATKVAHATARAAGVVRAVHAEIGAAVRAGAPLASIESAEVGADRARLSAAASREEAAKAAYDRESALREKGISATKDVLAARDAWETARAEHAALRAALGMIGADGPQSPTDSAGSHERMRYTVSAPIGGVVSRRSAVVGQMVAADTPLFEVVDTSTMWAEIDVSESDASLLAEGQSVSVRVEGLGDRTFDGRLIGVSPEVDPHTRTVRARAFLANPDAALRANLLARARVVTSRPRLSVLVPRAAVQRAHGVRLVFVRLDDDLYETRRVALGAVASDLVEVVAGVRPGERVVTEGSFLLKTETLKGSIGAGCCEVEPPSRSGD